MSVLTVIDPVFTWIDIEALSGNLASPFPLMSMLRLASAAPAGPSCSTNAAGNCSRTVAVTSNFAECSWLILSLAVDGGIRLRAPEVARGDKRIDEAADPGLFESLRQFGVARADGVRDDAQPITRPERGQHLEHIRDRLDRHLP